MVLPTEAKATYPAVEKQRTEFPHLESLSADDGLEAASKINEKALLRKLDITLLPALTLLYLLSFLDRSNVANARLEGLVTDLHITGNQYLTCLTIYFIGYVLFEIPCNIILKRTSPRLWLPTLTLAWGIVATLLGVTQNFAGFLVARFFLGVTESGLFPGVVFYLSMWYKRSEQTYRVALFFSAASLAGAFGGVLAWGIAHMRGVGGLNGWRWIFILEGILTIVVSAASYFFIFNYPSTAKFLSDDERSFIHQRLKADNDATRDEAFTWENVSKALKDPKVWLYGMAFHTMSLPLYTLSLFLPTIIKELGYTAAQAQLLTVPPYATAFTLTIIIAVVSEKARLRSPFIIGTSTLAIVGYIILITNHRGPGVSYFGTILAAAGIYPSCALVLAWPANNVSGQTKRAVANAMQISIGNLGAVLGTQLYRTQTAPRFFLGHGFALGYLTANVFVIAILYTVLKRENQRKERGERDERLQGIGEGEWLGDDDPRWLFLL
ncbi:MAG: hypothetical protein M1814_001864 [Vezdaea aestivalis]|nr:MAG: hypothetical protein M1814_001864 [Vezdaea aestivalis]